MASVCQFLVYANSIIQVFKLQPITDEENKAIQQKIIAIREEVYKKNEQEVSKRWTFEEGVSTWASIMHISTSIADSLNTDL